MTVRGGREDYSSTKSENRGPKGVPPVGRLSQPFNTVGSADYEPMETAVLENAANGAEFVWLTVRNSKLIRLTVRNSVNGTQLN